MLNFIESFRTKSAEIWNWIVFSKIYDSFRGLDVFNRCFDFVSSGFAKIV